MIYLILQAITSSNHISVSQIYNIIPTPWCMFENFVWFTYYFVSTLLCTKLSLIKLCHPRFLWKNFPKCFICKMSNPLHKCGHTLMYNIAMVWIYFYIWSFKSRRLNLLQSFSSFFLTGNYLPFKKGSGERQESM